MRMWSRTGKRLLYNCRILKTSVRNREPQWHLSHRSSVSLSVRCFASRDERPAGDTSSSPDRAPSPDSLRDTIHRIHAETSKNQEQSSTADAETQDHSNRNEPPLSSSSSSTSSQEDLWRQASQQWVSFSQGLTDAWNELVSSGQRKSINKKIHPVATKEGDKPYDGPVDIMLIDNAENLSAWERMQKRLTEAPIISDILGRTNEIYEKSGAKEYKQKIDVIKEDAQEAWETSQNPWVYRISSVYDTVTRESPETAAVRELRKLDPDFTLEDWKADVVEHTLPQIMHWFLEGRINQLKPWVGEGVFKRLAAEMKAREKEGVQIDTHVLGIMNSEILAVETDEVEKGSPIILLHFMVQQINCVRNKKDGKVVEGAEDDIRANSYVCAFQREYDEANGELNWKIIDFRFNGAIAYL